MGSATPILVLGNSNRKRFKGTSSNAVTTNVRLIEEFKTIRDDSLSNDLSKVETENTNDLKMSKENLDEVSDFSL